MIFSKQAGSNKRQDMLENTDIFVIKKDSKQCRTFRTQLNELIPNKFDQAGKNIKNHCEHDRVIGIPE